MRRALVALACAGIVAAISAGVVFAQNYEGEEFCPGHALVAERHLSGPDAPLPFGLLSRLRRAAWLGPVRHVGAGPAQLGHSRHPRTRLHGDRARRRRPPPPGPSATASAPTSSPPPVSLDRYIAIGGGHASAASVALSASVSENYEGENFCKDTPSWPNGTYLGQMHPSTRASIAVSPSGAMGPVRDLGAGPAPLGHSRLA